MKKKWLSIIIASCMILNSAIVLAPMGESYATETEGNTSGDEGIPSSGDDSNLNTDSDGQGSEDGSGFNTRGILLGSPQNIAEGECGQGTTYVWDKDTGVVTISGDGGIKDWAFNSPFVAQSSKVKKVIIEDGVTRIGSETFRDCSQLTSVEIADSVTFISFAAFKNCTSLTEITLPENLTALGVVNQSNGPFRGCTSLATINVGSKLEALHEGTFCGCPITEIALPKCLKRIDADVFKNCTSLSVVKYAGSRKSKKSITISTAGNSVLNTATWKYGESDPIGDCTITLSPTSYDYSGQECKPTVTVKDGNETLTKDTDYTLSYNNNVNAGTAKVTITGKGYYSGSVDKTFEIKGNPIGDCSITLTPTSFAYSGKKCTPAVTVKYGENTLSENTDYTLSYQNNVNVGTGKVTIAGKGKYTGSVDKTFEITSSESGSETSNNESGYCGEKDSNGVIGKNLTWIYSPSDGKLKIEGDGKMMGLSATDLNGSQDPWGTFRGNIRNVEIANAVTSLGKNIFSGTKIQEVVIPNSVNFIDKAAFRDCNDLKKAQILGEVRILHHSLFAGCGNLKELSLPKSICQFEDSVFDGCSSDLVIKVDRSETPNNLDGSDGIKGWIQKGNIIHDKSAILYSASGNNILQSCTWHFNNNKNAGFVIGRDNPFLQNVSAYFYSNSSKVDPTTPSAGKDFKLVKIKNDKYYLDGIMKNKRDQERMVKLQDKSDDLVVDNNNKFKGLCYGMCLSAIYIFKGSNAKGLLGYDDPNHYVNKYYNSYQGSQGNVGYADKDVKGGNKQVYNLRDWITLLQWLQDADEAIYEKGYYKTLNFENATANKSDFTHSIAKSMDECLKGLVKASKTSADDPVLVFFSKGVLNGGNHSFLICGYDQISYQGGNWHRLSIWNPNGNVYMNNAGADFFNPAYLLIRDDYKDYKYQNYVDGEYLDADNIEFLHDFTKSNENEIARLAYVTFNNLFTGKSGNSLTFDESQSFVAAIKHAAMDPVVPVPVVTHRSGMLSDPSGVIEDLVPLGGGETLDPLDSLSGQKTRLKFSDETESIALSELSGDVNYECTLGKDEYISVSGSRIKELSFEKNKGLTINGDNAKFTVYIVAKDSGGVLVKAEGVAEKSATFKYNDKKIEVDGVDLTKTKFSELDVGVEKKIDGSSGNGAIYVSKKSNYGSGNTNDGSFRTSGFSGASSGSSSSSGGGGGGSSTFYKKGKGAQKASYSKTGKGTVCYEFCAASKKIKKIIIPATVKIGKKKYKVTSIATQAFLGYDKVETIIIGKNVERIENNAFDSSKKLRTLIINSKGLTVKGTKGCLKDSAVKIVKAPKGKVKAYKKVFAKKNSGSKSAVKVKKK